MLQLELLWELQSIDNEIKVIKKNMKDRTAFNRLTEIKNEYTDFREITERYSKELEENIKKSARLNSDLKYLDQKIKDNNEKMYSQGSSLKIVDSLQKEVSAQKGQIDNIENELLKLLERKEWLESETANNRKQMLSLKGEFNSLKKVYTEETDENKIKLESLESKRQGIVKEVDMELISKYNNIVCRKNNPVSPVRNGVCMECGFKLNAILFENLKKGNKINLCDHCGRILYIEY
jgi:Zn-ribbon protein, possibly nucleic acid-binding